MTPDEVLGQGLSHPLRIGITGLAQSAGVGKVEESMRAILGTSYGERVMRPRFGSNLRSLVFAPNTSTTADLAAFYVSEALGRWEPRIEVLDVLVDNDLTGAKLDIDIRYRLRATAQEHQLVLPFPLESAG